MTPRPAVERCEVCTARLDPDRTTESRRCAEHRDQIALFDPAPPASAAVSPRPPTSTRRRTTPATSDTSGDRHASRARRTRTVTKD